MSQDEDFLEESLPPKRGMDTTTKVVLIMLTVGGVGLFLCCGGLMLGGWFVARSVSNSITMNPPDVRKATAEIADIEIPGEFEPKQSMRLDMLGMKMAMYGKPDSPEPQIIIMQSRFMSDSMDEQRKKEMMDSMRQQAGVSASDDGESAGEVRDIEIDGKKVPFQFNTVKQNGRQTQQIMGLVPLKSGMVMIMVIIPEEQYDEETVLQMLKSIREPQAGPGGLPVDPPMKVEAESQADHEARYHAPDPDKPQATGTAPVADPEASATPGEVQSDADRPTAVPAPLEK